MSLALTAVAQGGNLPMCASLLARLAAPCQMHERHHGDAHHTAPQFVQVMPDGSSEACHPNSTGPGCATGGVCPSGGPAAKAAVLAAVSVVPAVSDTRRGQASSYLSYLAPPLSPPPQA